jgi:hypothetical protein
MSGLVSEWVGEGEIRVDKSVSGLVSEWVGG